MKHHFRVVFDPFQLVMDIAQDLYPQTRADIYYTVGDLKTQGFAHTIFKEGKTIEIMIDAQAPLGACSELLAHEIAHAVVGIADGHGKAWRSVFRKIHLEYNKRVKILAKKSKLRAVYPYKAKVRT